MSVRVRSDLTREPAWRSVRARLNVSQEMSMGDAKVGLIDPSNSEAGAMVKAFIIHSHRLYIQPELKQTGS